jgi:thiol-disulfide isomerase/thioredoxin
MAVLLSTDKEFKSQLEKFDKVVVKYYAGWCGSCKLFAPKYRRLSGDERFDGVTFLDINAEENQEARKMAGVDNLPFFATFKNGVLVDAKATSKEEQLVEMISNLN